MTEKSEKPPSDATTIKEPRRGRSHPRAQHYVTITLDGDYPADGRVECDGGETAFCHLSCPHGCEAWTNDQAHPCGPDEAPHTLVAHDYCNVIESIAAVGVLDSHVGRQIVPGPRALIDIEWDEGYTWEFALTEPARVQSPDSAPSEDET